MKTYIAVGIGDMVFLDSILTPQEKESMTEIYWACRFGKDIAPLIENNPAYPNVTAQYFIDDEVGKAEMAKIDPVAVPFWHFRPDFSQSLETGLQLFGLKEAWLNGEVATVNAAGMFGDESRIYKGSSFLDKYTEKELHWKKPFILFQYPTSTRPRSDIASIDDGDWTFLLRLSKETGLNVCIVSDDQVGFDKEDTRRAFSDSVIFNGKDHNLETIFWLAANCTYYVGTDSFCAILAAKHLPKENIFVKIAPNVVNPDGTIRWDTKQQRYFLPHQPEDVKYFYKTYLGR